MDKMGVGKSSPLFYTSDTRGGEIESRTLSSKINTFNHLSYKLNGSNIIKLDVRYI